MTKREQLLDRIWKERQATRRIADLKRLVQESIMIDCLDQSSWMQVALIIHQLRQEGVHGPFAELRKVWE